MVQFCICFPVGLADMFFYGLMRITGCIGHIVHDTGCFVAVTHVQQYTGSNAAYYTCGN